jgi:hypothetical protein
VRLRKDTWEEFNTLMRDLGLRRDAYLNRVLPAEVVALNQTGSCDDAGAAYLVDRFRGDRSVQCQVSLRLDAQLIHTMNGVCATKRVVRDLFLENAIRFISARITPAKMLILEPRLLDRGVYRELQRASANLAEALDYGQMLIYDVQKVGEERALWDSLDRRLSPRPARPNRRRQSSEP